MVEETITNNHLYCPLLMNSKNGRCECMGPKCALSAFKKDPSYGIRYFCSLGNSDLRQKQITHILGS